jgi:hypothetical protein
MRRPQTALSPPPSAQPFASLLEELAAGCSAAVVELPPLAAGTARRLYLLAPAISIFSPLPNSWGVWVAARESCSLVAIEVSLPLA